MLALVLASLLLGSRQVRAENSFDYLAIIEVASAVHRHLREHAAGARDLCSCAAPVWASTRRPNIFWASGWLSAVLDNAPTYLVFFQDGRGRIGRRWTAARWPAWPCRC